jgi:phosphoglycerate dehydrogenase-like enzyme
MATVCITSEYFGKFSGRGREILVEAGHEVVDNPFGHRFLTTPDILSFVHDAQALVCDLERITREVMDAAPRLEIVARRGVGLDSVDLDEAKRRGIEVARTLDVVEKPVADLVLAYILEFARHLREGDAAMKSGRWEKVLGMGLEGKVLGLVGLGAIAGEVVRRAQSFGMEILYFDTVRQPKKERSLGVVYADLDDLLARSDFVSLHLPLIPETKGMFRYERIVQMKPTAYFINTARGAIVDEVDLARALRQGRIAGAAVDVYDVEPKTDSPLAGLQNVLLTPHVATFTRETFIEMDIRAAENIVAHFKGH